MGRPNRYQQIHKVREIIAHFFRKLDKKVFTIKELREVLQKNRTFLDLPKKTTPSEFILFLEKEKILQEGRVEMPNGEKIARYLAPEASVYELALSLKGGSYLSHYTAVFLHGLTDNIPKDLYTNLELRKMKEPPRKELQQENITRAFANNMRHSKQIASFNEMKIFLLNSKNVAQIGVKDLEWNGVTLAVTEVERTLIDITVRPDYAGGVNEVLNAYITAKDKVSINRLVATLKKINYIYPYHQAIGFYLERAGYREAAINLLEKQEMKNDFYLTYKMKNPAYSERWRLFYPKGL